MTKQEPRSSDAPPFGVMLMLRYVSSGMQAKVVSVEGPELAQLPLERAILQMGQLSSLAQSRRSWSVLWNSYMPHRPSADVGVRHGVQMPTRMRLQTWQQA